MVKMKHLLFVVLAFCCSMTTFAQDFSDEFRKVYESCMSLRSASVSGSTALMKSACAELKASDPGYFSILKCLDRTKPSLNGHFIFDYEFVDSLIVNKKVYSFAQGYSERMEKRESSSNDQVLMKTCCVGASSSSRYSFIAQGHQELAVVTEAGGLVNLRVYDATNGRWYNDDQDQNVGHPSRTRIFELSGGNVILEIEVINKTDNDVSFVIISN